VCYQCTIHAPNVPRASFLCESGSFTRLNQVFPPGFAPVAMASRRDKRLLVVGDFGAVDKIDFESEKRRQTFGRAPTLRAVAQYPAEITLCDPKVARHCRYHLTLTLPRHVRK